MKTLKFCAWFTVPIAIIAAEFTYAWNTFPHIAVCSVAAFIGGFLCGVSIQGDGLAAGLSASPAPSPAPPMPSCDTCVSWTANEGDPETGKCGSTAAHWHGAGVNTFGAWYCRDWTAAASPAPEEK